MTKVEVFTGNVGLVGVALEGAGDSEPFYRDKITVYGATPGELMDNLVEASVRLAENLFVWTMQNKPAHYVMGSDHWFLTNAHPSFSYSKFGLVEEEVGGGSAINSIDSIVTLTALARDLTIESLMVKLLGRGEMSVVDREKPFNDIYNVSSLQEKISCGYQGRHLDTILNQWQKMQEMEARVTAPSIPKRSWWKKN